MSLWTPKMFSVSQFPDRLFYFVPQCTNANDGLKFVETIDCTICFFFFLSKPDLQRCIDLFAQHFLSDLNEKEKRKKKL